MSAQLTLSLVNLIGVVLFAGLATAVWILVIAFGYHAWKTK